MDGLKANQTRLFLDMDGVFCDFERGVQELQQSLGVPLPYSSPTLDQQRKLWETIFENKPEFFAELKPMAGARMLWQAVKAYLARSGQIVPIFLTGCPKGKYRPLAEKGKRQWVANNILFTSNVDKVLVLSVDPDAGLRDHAEYLEALEKLLAVVDSDEAIVIFCRPEQKQFFSYPLKDGKTPLLLDDREKAGPRWEASGQAKFLFHESEPPLVEGEGHYTPGRTNKHFLEKSVRDMISVEAVKKTIATLQAVQGGGGSKKTHRVRRSKKNTRRNRSVYARNQISGK